MTMVKGGKHSMDGNHGNEKTPEDYERERKEREAKELDRINNEIKNYFDRLIYGA